MTTIKAELLLASKNAQTGDILYTWKLTYPRIILAEVNTHRVASRNSASSRAIPQKKQRRNVLDDPFVPLSLGANQKGMQAGAEITGWRRTAIESIWKMSRYPAALAQWSLDKLGAHKQVGNRLLEPWMWVQTVFSATEVNNIFKLRDHKDAEPHFHELARQMSEQVAGARGLFEGQNQRLLLHRYQVVQPGEWHLPFVSHADKSELWLRGLAGVVESKREAWYLERLKQVSTARCARVSYYLPDTGDRSDIKRDIEMCERLSSSGHWSPFEHVAKAADDSGYIGNFRGWKQYRKEFAGEDGE